MNIEYRQLAALGLSEKAIVDALTDISLEVYEHAYNSGFCLQPCDLHGQPLFYAGIRKDVFTRCGLADCDCAIMHKAFDAVVNKFSHSIYYINYINY